MKKVIYCLLPLVLFICSCTGVKTASSGLENEAYLSFVGTPSMYSEGLNVLIDDNLKFDAEVMKDFSDRPKGKVYAISPGAHQIQVSYKGEVIYLKKIFVSTQETKKIILK